MSAKITIQRDPRNKGKPYVVRWYGDELDPATGRIRRYSESFRTKAEAECFKAEKRAGFRRGELRDRPPDVTIEKFCRDWLRAKAGEVRPATLQLYGHTTERLKSYFGPDGCLRQINPIMAARFITDLQPLTGDKLSNWTKHRILRQCRTMFDRAVDWELIAKNPFKKVKGPKCVLHKWQYLSPAEYHRLLAAAPSLLWKARYALAYTGGLRKGEVFNLAWDDVNLTKNELRVCNRNGSSSMPPFSIKDSEERIIPLPEHTMRLLSDLSAYNQATDDGSPFVCLNQQQYKAALKKWHERKAQGRAWRNEDMVNNTLREFRRHLRKANIEPAGFTIHSLRKAAGKNWARINRDPGITQKLMGHSALSTTLKYYDTVTERDRQEAAAAVDKLLSNAEVQT